MSNKLIRLGPTGIEYGDYAWNFYSGCRHHEEGKCAANPCWAETFVKRFPKVYPNGFAPTFHPEAFLSPLALPKKKAFNRVDGKPRVLVNFMGDMFGDWVDPRQKFPLDLGYAKFDEMLYITIKNTILKRPDLTFVFCTKNPAGMQSWGKFPDNCEVGFSLTDSEEFLPRFEAMAEVNARVKWISIEPLLKWREDFYTDAWKEFDWVALGGLTGARGDLDRVIGDYPKLRFRHLSEKGNRYVLAPPVAWLKNIVSQCDAAGTKVFIKDNLSKWLTDYDFETHMADHDLFFETMSGLRQDCGGRISETVRVTEPNDGEFYQEPEVQEES